MYDISMAEVIAGRTPLRPVETICSIFTADQPIEALRAMLMTDNTARQAIRISTPSLSSALDSWLIDDRLRNRRVALRALAYVARMSARSTPFGICAGIGIVETGQHMTLSIRLGDRRTRTRPDMRVFADLEKLLETGKHRQAIRYSRNEAALVRGGRLYVTDIRLISEGPHRKEQRPVSLRNTRAVEHIRTLCAHPTTYASIIESVSKTFEASEIDSQRLVDSLIEAGVLLSELRVSPIGAPIEAMIASCEFIDKSVAAKLREIVSMAEAVDQCELEHRTDDDYARIFNACSALIEDDSRASVQVDLHSPFSGTLSRSVLRDAAQLGECYMRMGRNLALKNFRNRFAERYGGTERMVPLLELADVNLGLGSPEDPEHSQEEFSEREKLLMSIAAEAIRARTEEVVLSDEQFEIIAPERKAHEETSPIEVGFQLVAGSREAIDKGEYYLVPSAFLGTTGTARSLGRFMHLFDKDVLSKVRDLAQKSSTAVSAELVYAPPIAKNYNVFVRPRLQETEIRLGVAADRDDDSNRLLLDDLWVGMDDTKCFLWSNSRQSRINVAESHVFNTKGQAPNICRLISFIAMDGKRMLQGFPWGAASSLTELPRVRYKNLVMSHRRWLFVAGDFGTSDKSAQLALERLREDWNMPQYVYLREGDNLLLLDLRSSIAGELLFDQISTGQIVELQEALPSPQNLWLTEPTGSYVVEFVASLKPSKAFTAVDSKKYSTIENRVCYGPGSQWLYAKIFMGSQAMQDFLLRLLAPMIAEFRESYGLECWFFIRYSKPDDHLRVRFKSKLSEVSDLRECFLQSLELQLRDGVISRYALDMYDPEYERYGGPSIMPDVEKFFEMDSDSCLEVMRRADHSSDTRVSVAVETFYGYLLEDESLEETVLKAFTAAAKRKLNGVDRSALRRLSTAVFLSAKNTGLARALAGDGSENRLRALFHVHCNRLGLAPAVEGRAISLLRALVLSNIARRKVR